MGLACKPRAEALIDSRHSNGAAIAVLGAESAQSRMKWCLLRAVDRDWHASGFDDSFNGGHPGAEGTLRGVVG